MLFDMLLMRTLQRYNRWSESRKGWAILSEPLVDGEGGWCAQEAGTVAIFEGTKVFFERFAPECPAD